jgi:hypothetical protein
MHDQRLEAVTRDKAPKKTPFKDKTAKKRSKPQCIVISPDSARFGKEISVREPNRRNRVKLKEKAHASSNVSMVFLIPSAPRLSVPMPADSKSGKRRGKNKDCGAVR